MCPLTIRRWLRFIASGALLLQTTGCPDVEQIRNSAASAVSSFASGLIGMYVNAAVDAALGA